MTQRLHLASGLVLFAYLVLHLANHAVLLASLGTADAVLHAIYAVVTLPPVTAALLAAAGLHLALALLALYRRPALRFTLREALQYGLGFCIPLLLIPHVLGTRVLDAFHDVYFGYYRFVLLAFWHWAPWQAASQSVLLLAAWVHACIGLSGWLSLKRWYPAARPWLFAAALLLPALALAGFAAGGGEAGLRAATDPGFGAEAQRNAPGPELAAHLARVADLSRAGLLGAVLLVLAARQVRHWLRARAGLVRILYPDGRSIAVPRGVSVLEASRLLGIPHASVCGGRGRCSTCRVAVRGEPSALPAPAAEEARVLARVGAEGAAGPVRLACQLRPLGAVQVTPLLDAAEPPRRLLRFANPRLLGEEREVAILFADLRGFTRLSEHRLPFDVVHLLNRYFQAMGEAVQQAGGQVDKFIGDGVMALFGAGEARDTAAACRAGLEAARLMSLAMEALNRSMAGELEEELRIGIGLHMGPVILGELGHGRATGLTAIGDAVNAASRLEGESKRLGCELVVSDAVLRAAGTEPGGIGRAEEVAVRGRGAPLAVRAVPSAAALPPAAPAQAAAGRGRPLPGPSQPAAAVAPGTSSTMPS